MTVHDYEQKFIQLEKFSPTSCPNEKAYANKFIQGLRFALKDRVVNQMPQTLAQAMEIACFFEEMLDEQFRPLKKDKTKSASGNNNEGVTNQV